MVRPIVNEEALITDKETKELKNIILGQNKADKKRLDILLAHNRFKAVLKQMTVAPVTPVKVDDITGYPES